PDVTDERPREPGEDVAAQEVGGGKSRRKAERTGGIGATHTRDAARQSPERPHPGGHKEKREGRHPAVASDLDQERLHDPEERGRAIARPPGPGEPDATGGATLRRHERGHKRKRREGDEPQVPGCLPGRHGGTGERGKGNRPRGWPGVAPEETAQAGAHGQGFAGGRRTLSRFIRRGSASMTSNSVPLSCGITSPRAGTRPNSMKTKPPSVSISASSSGAASFRPISDSNSASGARAWTMYCPGFSSCQSPSSEVSCSSSISPITVSTRSSSVTSPSTPPYSSITSAMWIRSVCIFCRRTPIGMDGGA